jgi:hypothetical protein
LLRPEGLLLSVSLAAMAGWRFRKPDIPVKAVLAGIAGLGLFLLINYLAWGHLLPNSVLAKRAGVGVGLGEGLQSWAANLFLKGPMVGGTRVVAAAWVIFAATAAWGWIRSRRKADVLLPLLFWPGTYFLFFLLSGASYVHFTWYFAPPLPFLILSVGLGCKLAWEQNNARIPDVRKPWAPLWPQALALLLLFLAVITARRLDPAEKTRRAHVFREQRYALVAQYLDSLDTREPVLMDEVGVFVYRGSFPILDFHGILSPEVLPQVRRHAGHGPRLLALVEAFHPRWIAWTTWGEPGEDTSYGEFAVLRRDHELSRVFREPGSPHALHLWKRK